MKTSKTLNWFVRTRGSYLPKKWQGALLYLIYLAYLIWTLVFIFQQKYDFWPAVFFVVPNWVAACVIFSWIASRLSLK